MEDSPEDIVHVTFVQRDHDLVVKEEEEMKQSHVLNPNAQEFHMILRSPMADAGKKHILRSRSSKKKSKKTPTRAICEDDVNDNADSIVSKMQILESTPIKETQKARSPKVKKVSPKSNASKSRVSNVRSSLYAPTKSTMDKQRGRSSSISTVSGSDSRTINSGSSSGKTNRGNSIQPKGPTIPLTPKFKSDERFRMHIKSAILSTEDREMIAIEEARKLEVQRVAKAKKVFERVKIHSTNVVKNVVRSTKELTIPTTPTSHLTKRNGQKKCSNETAVAVKEVKKIEENFHNRPNTIFEEFKFATNARPSLKTSSGDGTVVLSDKEIAEKFFKDARSHGVSKETLKMTECHAPRFLTDIRAENDYRPKVLSTAEIEEAAFKEMQENSFKAKPLDKRIFRSMGELGVPKVAAKKGTEQVPFELRTARRTRSRSSVPSEADRTAAINFKARPMPTFSPEKIRAMNTYKPTIALSPKMSGGPRASSAPARRQKAHHTIVEQEKIKAAIIAATPIPMRMTLTDPVAFQFETADRGLVYKATLEQKAKIELAKEEAARIHHATTVPHTKPFQTAPSTKKLTGFEEFNLQSLQLHESELQVQQQENLKSNEENRLRRSFHARPMPETTHESDFQVEYENREPLVCQSMNFKLDKRAEKRKEFDDMMAIKMSELEKQKDMAALRKLEAENRRIKELRKLSVDEGGMTFRAGPISTVDQYPTKPVAPIMLTEPKSPAFSTMTHRGSVHGSLKDSEMADAYQAF